MEVVAFADPAEFAEAAFPYLERREAEHNLLLGITARLIDGGTGGWARSDEPPGFWIVLNGTEIAVAALMTPPYDLAVSHAPAGAPTALAGFLDAVGQDVPGVTGPRSEADEFAAAWQPLAGCSAKLRRKERIYRLTEVIPPTGVEGSARLAGAQDLRLLTDWLNAFAAFTGEPGDGEAAAADAIARGRALLWVDGEPVSLAAWGRMTPTGASVGPVYTPPENRGHGYASAATAALSAQLLASGRAFCCLYTDLDNPTSNRIYQRIGYQPLVDVNHYRFTLQR